MMPQYPSDDIVSLSKTDFEEILIYAERYAIGRMTYAPHTVCEIINNHLDDLTKNTLVVMKRDIETNREKDNLGSPNIDEPVWIETLRNIKRVLDGGR